MVRGLDRDWQWDELDDPHHGVRHVVFARAEEFRQIIRMYCRGRSCAVQAGGNFGVYPYVLAQEGFKQVWTFEPDPDLFNLLRHNVADQIAIHPLPYGLNATGGRARMTTDKPSNRGAQWTKPDAAGPVTMVNIDAMELKNPVDIIQLDIEGSEFEALKGAAWTITQHRPVIQLEHKDLGTRFGHKKADPIRWLIDNYDYKVVARPWRDIVLVPQEHKGHLISANGREKMRG
jgi:FkbM family methyltransferase